MSDLPLAPDWVEDILGPGYERRTFDLGADPDGQPPIVATLVRHFPTDTALNDAPSALHSAPATGLPEVEFARRPAILYVPGTSDYFFHKHVAEFFHSQGFALYSVDFRKCARSHREGQLWFFTSDIVTYFKDLNVVSRFIIDQGHPEIVMMGHSFGALVLAHWLDHLRRLRDSEIFPKVTGTILNAPWIELIYPLAMVSAIRKIAPTVAKYYPKLPLFKRKWRAYVASLHRDYQGEWDFNLEYKPLGGHDKYWGWVREVIKNIDRIQEGAVNCGVPVLVLCSLTSSSGRVFTDQTHTTDAVLDVDDIITYSTLLGDNVTTIPIEDAKHDVFLSQDKPRKQALRTCIDWLRDVKDTRRSVNR
ncbi:alpha/beta hydrolase [Staphylococcus chromogenes]|nr:alpha/beta hydrolase [Staphylococcus chromogenes]